MSPSGSVTCQIFPDRQTNVAHLKICFEIVLETLSLPPLCSGARTQLSEEDLLGEARVHQPDNMTSPTQLIFDYHGLDTGALCFVKDAGICPLILPGHTQDASQAARMVLFQDVKVSPIGRPGLRAIKEGRKHDSLVHKEVGVFPRTPLRKHSLTKPSKGTACSLKAMKSLRLDVSFC